MFALKLFTLVSFLLVKVISGNSTLSSMTTLNSTLPDNFVSNSTLTTPKGLKTTTTPSSMLEGSHPAILSVNVTQISDQDLQIIKDICRNHSCVNQTRRARERRAVIMQIRLEALKRNVAYRLNPALAQKTVEGSMALVFKAKQAYLKMFGIPEDLVVPADDGLFFGHVLLADPTVAQIIATPLQAPSIPLWPNIIPYFISPNISNSTANLIDDIVSQLENQTCIRFLKKTKVFEYELSSVLTFEELPAESNNMWCIVSTLGHFSQSFIYLNPNCTSTTSASEEIMHALMYVLGVVGHEINRLDREKYVSIRWENIHPDLYDVYSVSGWKSVYGLPFDHKSVTNLGPTFGLKNDGEVTAIWKNTTEAPPAVGQRSKFSCGDLHILKKMYCCPGCFDVQQSCGYLAAFGLCQHPKHWFWMKLNCAKSCEYCCQKSCPTRPDCSDSCFNKYNLYSN